MKRRMSVSRCCCTSEGCTVNGGTALTAPYTNDFTNSLSSPLGIEDPGITGTFYQPSVTGGLLECEGAINTGGRQVVFPFEIPGAGETIQFDIDYDFGFATALPRPSPSTFYADCFINFGFTPTPTTTIPTTYRTQLACNFSGTVYPSRVNGTVSITVTRSAGGGALTFSNNPSVPLSTPDTCYYIFAVSCFTTVEGLFVPYSDGPVGSWDNFSITSV